MNNIPSPVTKLSLKPEIAYLDEYVKIETDDNLKYIYVEWLKHPTSEAFRRGFYKAAELTIDAGYLYWLSDSRTVHYIEFADQNWMLDQIMPLLPKAKLLKFARITTLESIALMDLSRIFNSLDDLTTSGISTTLEVFTNKEDALDWLFPEFL